MNETMAWPRPRMVPAPRYPEDAAGRPVPLPWINGEQDPSNEYGDFYSFRDDCRRAHTERLCCICGDALGAVVAIGAYRGDRETSGGWGHPRCIQTAVRLCPHFAGLTETVAWLHVGPGVGVDDPCYEIDVVVDTALPLDRAALLDLSRRDPLGTIPTPRPVAAEQTTPGTGGA